MIYRLTFFVVALLIRPSFASEWNQGLSLSIVQQQQRFQINNEETHLAVRSPNFQYLVSKGPWSVNLSFNEGNASESQLNSGNNSRYSLRFEQSSYSLFLDYGLDDYWLSMGYLTSSETQAYWASADSIRTLSGNDIDIQSIVIEAGSGWYFSDSQFTASIAFTHQAIEEAFNFFQSTSVPLSATSFNNDEYNENAYIGDLRLQYQYYLPLNEQGHGVIGIGIQHSETLDGSANISQTSKVRVAGNQLLSNEDELYIESASESTSIQIQLGYLLDYGSINLAADKLVDDDWRDALIELGITLYF